MTTPAIAPLPLPLPSPISHPLSPLSPTTETLYIPLAPGRQAILTITILQEGLHAMDRPTLATPTAREVHEVAEKLFHRLYQFFAED